MEEGGSLAWDASPVRRKNDESRVLARWTVSERRVQQQVTRQ